MGVIVFATSKSYWLGYSREGIIKFVVVGNVGSIIASMNAVHADFRQKVDQVRQYMTFRRVGQDLERRVVTWFDYLWLQKQVVNEELILGKRLFFLV